MVGGGAVWGLMDDMVDRWERGASRWRFRRGGSLSSGLVVTVSIGGVEWYREAWGDREWCEMLHGSLLGGWWLGLRALEPRYLRYLPRVTLMRAHWTGPGCILRPLLSPISTYNLRVRNQTPWTASTRVLVVIT